MVRSGRTLVDEDVSPAERRLGELAARYAASLIDGPDAVLDELTEQVWAAFDEPARAKLLVAIGYLIGIQHLSRGLHFESPGRCPV